MSVSSRVKSLAGEHRQKVIDRIFIGEGKFQCIQHMDAWFNNFMYR